VHEVDLLLAERDAAAPGRVEVALPESVSVSVLVGLRADPQRLARRLRRPLPDRPHPYARRGTAFHAWVEQRFQGDQLLDVDELPGAGDSDAAPETAFEDLKQAFQASEWGDRTPVAVEVPFTAVLAAASEFGGQHTPRQGTPEPSGAGASGVVVRGRIDAVFADPDGGYDVIDWKTGRRPSGRDADAAAVQLAAYRLAWARLAGVPVAEVRAGFHYVPDNVTVRPVDLLDADGLSALVAELPEARSWVVGR
ncbi:MAG: PD-(D/E)XK nuclease family protein, partial [Micromonosporaceae bacterium]